MKVGLISCVKTKLDYPAKAKDLYVSALFRGMRRYVEPRCDRWYILSAEYGLLHPEQVVKPYEKTLVVMSVEDRRAWAEGVMRKLRRCVPASSRLIILAGARYRDELAPLLRERWDVEPDLLAGKKLGERLQWLKEHA